MFYLISCTSRGVPFLFTLSTNRKSKILTPFRLSLDLGSDGFVVESTLVTPDMQTVDYVRALPALFLTISGEPKKIHVLKSCFRITMALWLPKHLSEPHTNSCTAHLQS